MANLKYWLWLSGRRGLAGQNMMRVLNHFGSPESVYFSDIGEYNVVGGLSAAAIQSLADKSMAEVDRILEKIKKGGYSSLSDDEKRRLFDASSK